MRQKVFYSGLFWLKNQRGQMSIFFATSMLIMITIIAFVINIGTFVKAKINLQNAVDAAAYAGAAVQARQLTNMAHLNWEMRNNYKEWMFKYYIMGGLGLDTVANGPDGDITDFRANTINFGPVSGDNIYNNPRDHYNFPSICINFADLGTPGGNRGNNCSIFNVPGLPDFSAQSVAVGIDNTTTAFINNIAQEKANNCSNLTSANYLTAHLWAYNIETEESDVEQIKDIAPSIMADRMGAWPRAFELGIRMRNLEYQMNRKPFENGVCENQGNAAGSCSTEISEISSQGMASDERIFKAYKSAFRNLGNQVDREMKTTFTLTEIPPEPFTPGERSLSDVLIPTSYPKYYVDLKLVSLNLTTFFTMFQTSSGTMQSSVQSTANCTQTKVGLPIPGYPLGFVKNPDILSYYAVKGEAEFVGLFNPFNKPIKLTAYAAAKPFGGRIGPNLFNTKSNVSVTSRNDIRRSGSYISGIDVSTMVDPEGVALALNDHKPGVPIPLSTTSSKYWVQDVDDILGGGYFDPDKVVFGIPNLVYDYINEDKTGSEYQSSERLQILKAELEGPNSPAGLYNAEMFSKFRANMEFPATFTPDVFYQGVMNARAPTLYDALNYMVPTPTEVNEQFKVDSFAVIPTGKTEQGIYSLRLYAPLFGEGDDFLFHGAGELQQVLGEFIGNQRIVMEKYRTTLNDIAIKMYQGTRSASSVNIAEQAASIISDLPSIATPSPDTDLPTCNSINGKFLSFFLGSGADVVRDPSGCPRSLETGLVEYWSEITSKDTTLFFDTEYKVPTDENVRKALFSAYMPGPFQGANDGVLTNPLNGSRETMRRNFYSTKFITLDSVSSGSDATYQNSEFMIISEGRTSVSGRENIQNDGIQNPINKGIFDWGDTSH